MHAERAQKREMMCFRALKVSTCLSVLSAPTPVLEKGPTDNRFGSSIICKISVGIPLPALRLLERLANLATVLRSS